MQESTGNPTRLLIIGHSHIECIEEAVRQRGAATPTVNLWGVPDAVVEGQGGVRLNDNLQGMMGGDVVSVVGGGSHHVMGLSPHPTVYDFVLPEAPDLPLIEGAEILPVDQVRATLRSITMEELHLLRLIAETARGKVIHLLPPPPMRDEAPMDHPIWHERVGRSATVSPPHFRLKLDRLHADMLAQACADAGITLLPPPPESKDAEGFLRPDLWGRPCHGNALYGALVLDQLRGLTA